MKDVIDKLKRKIAICQLGGKTDWNDGYITGVQESLDAIYEKTYNLMIPWNDYYVILFEDGDPFRPYAQKMRLYQISGNTAKKFFFTKNLNAVNRFEVTQDIILKSPKDVRERVYYTKDDAEKAVEDLLQGNLDF